MIGIQSGFAYGSGDFINALTTPYGTTTFVYGEVVVNNNPANWRWLEATDPLGGTERVEYRPQAPGIADSDPANTLPQGMPATYGLSYRNSFYWDKRALSLYRGDNTKATIYHFLHLDSNTASGIIESIKRPLGESGVVPISRPGRSARHRDHRATNHSGSCAR